jgi:tRNA (adenine9-N1/guanine9-N1)-methyltransferase
MIPADVLQFVLRLSGAEGVLLSTAVFRELKREIDVLTGAKVLHHVANLLLTGRARICAQVSRGKEIGHYKGITVGVEVKGVTTFDYVVKSNKEKCDNDVTQIIISKFIDIYPRVPLIIFDALFWELHSDEEKKDAIQQFLFAVKTIRKYLTDLNIVVLSPSSELIDLINSFRNRINVITPASSITLPNKGVILDPYSNESLTIEEVLQADAIVVGLLVDSRFPRPYATYAMSLIRRLPYIRKAIVYKGSIVGVPKEINKIIEILLKVRFEGMSLDNAVKDTMGVDNKIYRVVYEVSKLCGKGKTVDKETIVSIMEELSLDKKYFNRVISRIKALNCWRESVEL